MEPREYSSEASACMSSWLWTPTPLKTKKHFLFKKQTWYMYMWQCWEHRFCTGNVYVKEIPMFLVWAAAWSWLRLRHCCYLLLSEDMAESETIWKSLSVTCPDSEHFSASSPAQRSHQGKPCCWLYPTLRGKAIISKPEFSNSRTYFFRQVGLPALWEHSDREWTHAIPSAGPKASNLSQA